MRAAVSADVWQRAQTGHYRTWQAYVESGERASEDRRAVWRAILDEVRGFASPESGQRVLDIGCGLDTVLDFLDGVRGYTLDSLMHRLAEFGLSGSAEHAAGLFEALPYRDASFDRVFLMNVLDHVRDPARGLAEVARVLRPGGALVLSVDTYAGQKYLQKRARKWWDRTRGASTKHPWVFSVQDTTRLLQRLGFEPRTSLHVVGTKARRTMFGAVRL